MSKNTDLTLRENNDDVVRLALRMDKKLHEWLRAKAKAERRSINSELLAMIQNEMDKSASTKTSQADHSAG